MKIVKSLELGLSLQVDKLNTATLHFHVTCICSLNTRPGFLGNSYGLKLHFPHFDYCSSSPTLYLNLQKQHMNPQINCVVFLKLNQEQRYSTHGVLGSSTSSK